MQFSLFSGAAVGLLLVLLSTVRSGAVQPEAEEQQDATTVMEQQDATVSGTLEHLWALFDGAVKTVTQAVAAGVDGRLTEVQTQCLAQADQVSGQMANVSTQLGAELKTLEAELKTELEVQNVALAAQNDNLTHQLDGVRSELSTQNTQLSAQDAQLSDLNTQLSGQTTQLSDLNTQLSGQTTQLSDLTTDLSAQSSELNHVRSELSAVQNQLGKLSKKLSPVPPRDCSDLPAGATSGVHLLQPGLRQPAAALCDQATDGGGWTVFQRRADVKPRLDFFLGWEEYKQGFGELDGEFWWGMERLWLTTSQLDRRYELRIDLEDFEGERRHAVYQGFRIASEKDNYRLTAVNYTGDAGDSLGGHTGHPFSTKDRDNDIYSKNCAEIFNGAWWYTKCHSSNLNGRYLAGQHDSYANGINWSPWKGQHYSMKTATMKIRPTKKL